MYDCPAHQELEVMSHSVQAITRPFHYAIVDEADSLLIDDCRNPLIISAEPDTGATERFLLAHKVPNPDVKFCSRVTVSVRLGSLPLISEPMYPV